MAAVLASTFGAGRATAPLARVSGGISHALFRLQTTTGQYAAKRLNVGSSQQWWDGYHAAARIEQAPAAKGVRLPHRLSPLVAVLDLDGVQSHWQVHDWCDGRQPTEPEDSVAEWTGITLALLHRQPPSEDHTSRPALYPLDS